MRDSDATLIITDSGGIAVSVGTSRGQQWAQQHGKPLLVVDATEPNAAQCAAAWVEAQQQRFGVDMTLSIGGPRQSEAPGIYGRSRQLIAAMLDHLP